MDGSGPEGGDAAGPSGGQRRDAHRDLPSPGHRITRVPRSRRHVVCMVCDFFFPRLGGVEMHVWSQCQCLMAMGHKVIVVTNARGDRRGVRWMTNGLKVYYLPLASFVDGIVLPTLGLAYFPLFRSILIREGVTVVHGHQVCACELLTGDVALRCAALDPLRLVRCVWYVRGTYLRPHPRWHTSAFSWHAPWGTQYVIEAPLRIEYCRKR